MVLAEWAKIVIQLYAVSKRLTLDSKAQIGSGRTEKIYHTNSKQNRAGCSILIIDKVDFKTKIFTRDKEQHFKVNSQSKYNTYNTYSPNNRAPKYTNQK